MAGGVPQQKGRKLVSDYAHDIGNSIASTAFTVTSQGMNEDYGTSTGLLGNSWIFVVLLLVWCGGGYYIRYLPIVMEDCSLEDFGDLLPVRYFALRMLLLDLNGLILKICHQEYITALLIVDEVYMVLRIFISEKSRSFRCCISEDGSQYNGGVRNNVGYDPDGVNAVDMNGYADKQDTYNMGNDPDDINTVNMNGYVGNQDAGSFVDTP